MDAISSGVPMRFSNDGGKTWGAEQWRAAGKVGEYGARVKWERLGSARRRTYEIAVSDPIPWRVTNAYLSSPQPPAKLSQVQLASWSG